MEIDRNLICSVCGKRRKENPKESFVKIVDSKCGEIISGKKCGGNWKVDVSVEELNAQAKKLETMTEREQKIARATFAALQSGKRIKLSDILKKEG